MRDFLDTPTASDNLLMRIRAEDLLANLARTSERLGELPNLDKGLKTLSTHLIELRTQFFEIRNNVIEKWVTDSLENGTGPSDEAIEKARTRVGGLLAKFKTALKDADDIMKMSYMAQDGAIVEELSKGFNTSVFEPKKKLQAIKEALMQADTAHSMWKDFTEKALGPSRAVFSQCIEVLGGIALRDSRFDQGICALAEELIRTYPASSTPTRAMPAGSAAVDITLTRIVRLIYPEWTIWSLPLVAHEFWHTAACKDFEIYFGRPRRQVGPRFEDCLADAFATFTLGPAYPYAAIVLLLDPNAPYSDKEGMVCDEIRAQVILGMLQKMDTTIGLDPFTIIAERLQRAWDAAKAQTGAQPNEEERNKLDTESPLAKKLVSEAWEALKETRCVPFAPDMWNEIERWRDDLLGGRQIELKLDANLSKALNAAWAARVASNRDPDVDLVGRVQKLVDRILEGLREFRQKSAQRGGWA